MKKRLLALALLLAMVLSLAPAAAADTVYFTSINDTLSPLSDSTMPYWSGGYLYVPATCFNGQDIGVYYSRSADKQTVILYAGKRALSFDLAEDATYDSFGNIYAERAQLRRSVVYVPVARVASFFGLTYTNTKVDHGYMVRVRDQSAVLSDRQFIEAAAQLMNSWYSDYKKASGAQNTPSTPAAGEDPAGTEEPDFGGNTLSLCFLVTDVTVGEQLAGTLSTGRGTGTFYVAAELVSSAGDFLRRLTAQGFSVGLAAGGDDAEGALAALQAANDALFRATGSTTRLALLTGSAPAEDVEAAGYRVLKPRVTASTLTSSAQASALLRRIGQRQGVVTVYLGEGANSSGVYALLTRGREEDNRFVAMTETT